jgi:hypothetical protein
VAAEPDSGRPGFLWSFVLVGVLTLLVAGCQSGAGSGHPNRKVADLKVGGDARLVSFDGADIILDPYVSTPQGKTGRRPPRTTKVAKVKLPVGTLVLVRDLVGDDAHVEIKDGSSAGSNYWVECIRLEPVAK